MVMQTTYNLCTQSLKLRCEADRLRFLALCLNRQSKDERRALESRADELSEHRRQVLGRIPLPAKEVYNC